MRGLATFACSDTPLRSSWSKELTKRYAYYLCQTKGCEACGKSIPRDKLENDFGEIIKTLEPTQGLVTIATRMFKDAWAIRSEQAKAKIQSAKRQVVKIESEIDQVLGRIVESSNSAVIRAYENKIAKLEYDKVCLSDIAVKERPPQRAFDEKLELALRLLKTPVKYGKVAMFEHAA